MNILYIPVIYMFCVRIGVETFKPINQAYNSEMVIEVMFDTSKIEFYNEIKTMLEEFNDNIDYFEHKAYINKLIDNTKVNLENEFNLLS